MLVHETNLGETTHHNSHSLTLIVGAFHRAEFFKLKTAVALGDDGGVGSGVGGDTTGVERTERQLRTRFTDGLCGDDADSFAFLHHAAGGKVATVALLTNAMTTLAGKDRTDFNALNGRGFNLSGDGFGDFFAGSDDEFTGGGVDDVMHRHTTEDSFAQRGDDLVAVLEGTADETAKRAAVFFGDDDVVGDIDETASEVTGVGGLQGGVGKTLTGTVGGDEVFQHGHAFLEVGENRVLNDLCAFGTGFLRLRHQTTHTCQLGNLVGRTTGTGVKHHEDGVETLVGFGHLFHEGLLEVGVHVSPGVDDLVVAFVVGDEAHVIVHGNLVDFFITFLDDVHLLFRDDDVIEVEGESAFVCHAIAEVLDTVEEVASTCHTDGLDDLGDDVAERLLGDDSVDVATLHGDYLIDNDTSDGGFNQVLAGEAAVIDVIHHHFDGGMDIHALFIVGNECLFCTVEGETRTLGARTEFGDVVKTKHHVLRGHGDGRTVGGVEDVVALKHEHLCFQDGFVAQGEVNCHLVTVEVGVEGGTCQRVELNGFAFNHLGLERLNTETVKGRCTVEEDGVSLHDVLEDVPNDGLTTIHNLLGTLDGLHNAALNELADDEGLIELGCHEFRQTALAHLQLGTNHDDGTSGIVHTLTEEVLTETTLLSFERVGQRFERTVAVALDGRTLAGVVEETINRFLKHALLVSENDFGSLDFQKSLQTIVANEDTTIEVVEVGCGKTTTIQRHERTQVGRSDGNNLHNHPLGFVAVAADAEGFNHLQTLERIVLALHRRV